MTHRAGAALFLVLLLSLPAVAGREVRNDDGRLNGIYREAVVKNRSQDRLWRGVEIDVEEDRVEVRFARPLELRAESFYDWGYQLEITCRQPDSGDLYIITVDRTGTRAGGYGY